MRCRFLSVFLTILLACTSASAGSAEPETSAPQLREEVCNVIDSRLLREMEMGRKLKLEVVDSNLLTVPTTILLDQFAAMHKGAPTNTIEFPPDEE